MDCPTMEMPRKFTVSMLRVTVMMLSERVESVTLEMELVRDRWAGCNRVYQHKLIIISIGEPEPEPKPKGGFRSGSGFTQKRFKNRKKILS